MKSKKNFSLNWTGNVKAQPKILFPKSIEELKKIINKKNYIPAGNQRSFGDNSINPKLVISMKNFDEVISFNKSKGIIEIQSGAILKNILEIIIKGGWFIPVTPGTKYVSVGGMIANNIHGKNTFHNQIKYHIKEIKLLTTRKKIITCSKTKNKNFFEMTVGGYGLSGFILSAKIKLKKIKSTHMEQEILEFKNFNEFFSLLKKIRKYEYNVSWIDNFNHNKIKGLCYFGNHPKKKEIHKNQTFFTERKIKFFNFLILKIFTQNYYLIKITKFFFRKLKSTFYNKKCSINEFFYPQDYFINWNKIYGNKGFFQVQFLVNEKNFIKVLNEISLFFSKEKIFSTFIIIKKFDEKGKYMNFYGKGFSISMDIPKNSKFLKTKTFLNYLFRKFNARINFAKDLIYNHKNFKKNKEYVKFKKNLRITDPSNKLNSFFSKRLNL